jgi:hypothetical protein
MSDKTKFTKQVEEYQKCLNTYYDKFINGEDTNFTNICQDELTKLKSQEYYYKPFESEFINNKTKLD